jgi:1-acyl-sn-glycerol-3-phosphate acyltransferase
MKTIKLISFVVLVAFYFLTTVPFYPLFLLFPMTVRSVLIQQVSFYSKLLLKVLGIKTDFKNLQTHHQNQNYLVVSNHLSYLDVLVLASKIPACFVTSFEIKQTPFLGQLCSLAGCLFVDRKNRSGLKGEINELRDALKSGLNVIVFPEATSTDGSEVLRFKRPLFESSVATGKAILPMTINYQLISQEPVSLNNRDVVCWYGDMDFFPHFLTLLEQTEVKVEVILNAPFLPEFLPTQELALKSHQLISSSFRPLNMPIA